MEVPNRELEQSALSGLFTREGITVEVLIYRFANVADSWSLEVVDQEGGSTVWTESFLSDQAAHKAFLLSVEEDGMSQFLEPVETLH
ncbi:hypothetical protein [Methylobacterium sp. J-068]|uniref:hypothetical protein n=1 Tax=Methylobacterium sp. J-068 TaxID=2836649 RepID=UPI001FB8EBA4|nr:hypothetical protein [Methylobacterium sp. J-068]MCJ2035769.1 hypothetical protein [Methylobacterium sp. J-068]